MVTCSILSFGDVNGVVRHFFQVLAVKIALTLLCYHIFDFCLFCIEIIIDTLHLICTLSLSHYRTSYNLSCCVWHSLGKNSV